VQKPTLGEPAPRRFPSSPAWVDLAIARRATGDDQSARSFAFARWVLMPPRPVLVALLALAVLPPFVAQARGSVIGSYTMFHSLSRYHVELAVVVEGQERRVEMRSVAPHLSPEARTIVVPAGGRAVGADQVEVVAASLPDLARLLCALHPGAERARAGLSRDPFDATRVSESSAEVACRNAR